MGQIESKEKIYWVNDVEKAVLIANFTKKPVFLMIMKSFCPTCKYIEPEYVEDKDFRVLSKFFVMVINKKKFFYRLPFDETTTTTKTITTTKKAYSNEQPRSPQSITLIVYTNERALNH